MRLNPIRQHSTMIHQSPPTATDAGFRYFRDSANVNGRSPSSTHSAVDWLYGPRNTSRITAWGSRPYRRHYNPLIRFTRKPETATAKEELETCTTLKSAEATT